MSEELAIHPRWRGWIAENMARGAPADEVVAALREEGVDEELARACIAQLEGSDGLREARRLWHRVRALEQMVRLRGRLRDAIPDGRESIERRKLPPVPEFLARYWVPGIPVIFTDLVTQWPAYERWSPDDMKARLGDVQVEACMGRSSVATPDAKWEQTTRSLPMREFVEMIVTATDGNDAYIIAKNAALARPELQLLLEDFGEPKEYFGEKLNPERMALWFGAAGTHTPLHHDGDNSMFCQVVGRKRFRIAPPESLELLERSRGVYSQWDPIDPGALDEGPEHLFELVLQPGEALFIPAGWWHQVDALDVSMSVSILNFAWPNDFDWYKPGTSLRGRGDAD